MKNSKNDLGCLFKSEADELLFKDIEFTSDMKHEIQKKIHQDPSPTSSARVKWSRSKSIYGVLAVAGLAGVLWISSTLFQSSEQPEVIDTPNLFITPDDEVSSPIDGPQKRGWEVASMDEAENLMGERLLLPTYQPDGYTLDRIHVLGDKKSDPDKIIFTYVSGENSYLIIVDQYRSQLGYENFKKIDINGSIGYVIENEYDSEVHFFVDELHYMVSGLISKEEAIKIAEGLQ